jgi:choline-sulfatase
MEISRCRAGGGRRAAGGVLALVLLASCVRREVPHPNVLLITLDTFRADRVGAGTPNLLKLARSGMWFRQADSVAPLTLPSHATMLSGLLPPHHGLRNNGIGSFPAKQETLATLFSRAGYRTGAFVSAFVLDRRFGLARGFATYDDEIARDPNDTASIFEAERRGGETVDRALAWLRRGDARPWFAWVHLYDAHAPYAPPTPFPQTYDGEIAYVDAQVGRLLSAIDRTKTIVIIVGDHGEALGEHSELTHGLLLYESTLHVPLIMVAPSINAREVQQPVSTVDVAPTIASLAGVAFAHTDGHNIVWVPALSRHRPAEGPGSTPIYAESEYAKTFGWSALNSIRKDNIKLIRGSTAEMFDLSSDPGETRNIINEQRRLYVDLARRLDEISRSAIASAGGVVDEETRSKLASLGYVAPGQSARPSNRDPRAMAPLFRRYEEATWAMNAGRRRESIVALEQLTREDSSNGVFRLTLARAYKQAGASDRALGLYRQAVALSPADPDAWYNLAAALQEAGRVAEAEKVSEEAERLDPARPDVHNVRGVALIESGDPAGAETEFRKAIELDPRSARAYNNLGNVLRIAGRAAEAQAAYRKALEIAPRYADAMNGMGVLLVQSGQARAAINQFDAALGVAPDFYEAELNRAIALQIAGDANLAAEELRRLLRRLPPGRAYDGQRNAARTLLSRLKH